MIGQLRGRDLARTSRSAAKRPNNNDKNMKATDDKKVIRTYVQSC